MMDILVIFIFLVIISNTARNILVYAFWSMSVSAALGVEKWVTVCAHAPLTR